MRGLGPSSGIKEGEHINKFYRSADNDSLVGYGYHNPHGPDWNSGTDMKHYYLNIVKIME